MGELAINLPACRIAGPPFDRTVTLSVLDEPEHLEEDTNPANALAKHLESGLWSLQSLSGAEDGLRIGAA